MHPRGDWPGGAFPAMVKPMLLKAFILLVAISLGVTLFVRQPQARRTGWIVVGSLVLLGLLAIQLLRTLDTLWR